MSPPPWATPAQLKFLNERRAEFKNHQKEKTLTVFWETLHRDFFKLWDTPEAEALDAIPEEPSKNKRRRSRAPKEETWPSIDAWVDDRKNKLNNWFNNHGIGKKSRTKGPVIQLGLNLSEQPKRLQTELHLYSKKYFAERVKPGVDAECLAKGIDDHGRIAVVNRHLAENYANESDEVKEEIRGLRKEQEEAKEAAREATSNVKEEMSPEEYASAIDYLPEIFDEFCKYVDKTTGWAVTVIAGGPDPLKDGKIRTIGYHSHRNRYGLSFGKASKSFNDSYLKPFSAFLHTVYLPEDMKKRAIGYVADKEGSAALAPAKATSGDISEKMQGGEDGVPVPIPLDPKKTPTLLPTADQPQQNDKDVSATAADTPLNAKALANSDGENAPLIQNKSTKGVSEGLQEDVMSPPTSRMVVLTAHKENAPRSNALDSSASMSQMPQDGFSLYGPHPGCAPPISGHPALGQTTARPAGQDSPTPASQMGCDVSITHAAYSNYPEFAQPTSFGQPTLCDQVALPQNGPSGGDAAAAMNDLPSFNENESLWKNLHLMSDEEFNQLCDSTYYALPPPNQSNGGFNFSHIDLSRLDISTGLSTVAPLTLPTQEDPMNLETASGLHTAANTVAPHTSSDQESFASTGSMAPSGVKDVALAGPASELPAESERTIRNRKPAGSKEVVALTQHQSSKDPEWLELASQYLADGVGDTEWQALVQAWLLFERENILLSTAHRLPTAKMRPDELSKWLSSRKYQSTPPISNIAAFANQWCRWWNSLQPTSRQKDGPSIPAPLSALGDKMNLSTIKRGGPNGLLTVLIGLKWWATVRADDARWFAAVKDIHECFDSFGKAGTKRKCAGEEGNTSKKKRTDA